jgi:mannitol/fructose-specific phosphotransferase system IIA component (Ntr-type)
MTSITQILRPEHVNLSLQAADQAAAVEELLFPLRGDIHILNWDAFRDSVFERNAPAVSGSNDCGIIIAHGRTNAVSSLVMAAGRSPNGFSSPDIPEKVRLVFVAGIPSALNNEYLRIVGTIARFCSKPALLEQLLSAKSAHDFLEILQEEEKKL